MQPSHTQSTQSWFCCSVGVYTPLSLYLQLDWTALNQQPDILTTVVIPKYIEFQHPSQLCTSTGWVPTPYKEFPRQRLTISSEKQSSPAKVIKLATKLPLLKMFATHKPTTLTWAKQTAIEWRSDFNLNNWDCTS